MSDPVKDGRDALDHSWFGYPWYDAKTDGVRRVEVSQPWEPWQINLPIGTACNGPPGSRSRSCWPGPFIF